jgi:hypothetical protein
MARKREGDLLRRDDRVVAAIDLPGIPAGTAGRVKLVNGFSWVRYWVSFENGHDAGTLDRSELTLVDKAGRPIEIVA